MDAEKISACVAQLGGLFTLSCGGIAWLDDHYRAVLALCAIGGFIISGVSLLIQLIIHARKIGK